jgi:predicted DNA-binding protein
MAKNNTSGANVKTVTIDLPEETIKKLTDLANEQNITATSALIKAIETEEYIREVSKDAKVLIQDSEGKTKQVRFS